MKKASLKGLKKQNKTLLLHLLIEQPGISRIALAEQSKLSPATVSSLVSEMLKEGILSETGEEKSTGGRRRVCLTLNADYAVIPVFNVSRSRVSLSIFDMQLRPLRTSVIYNGMTDGNTLFCKICEAVADCVTAKDKPQHALGIGLAFQDDLSDKDFSVMYSTSVSSETIPLETALSSQLHVTVVSDFFGHLIPKAEKVGAFLNGETVEGDYAWVHMGETAWASVVVGGRLISMMGHDTFNLSPLLEQPGELPWKNLLAVVPGPQAEAHGEWKAAAARMVQALLALSVFFPVKNFLLEGLCFQHSGFMEALCKAWADRFGGKAGAPRLLPVCQGVPHGYQGVLAERVRMKSLLSV